MLEMPYLASGRAEWQPSAYGPLLVLNALNQANHSLQCDLLARLTLGAEGLSKPAGDGQPARTVHSIAERWPTQILSLTERNPRPREQQGFGEQPIGLEPGS